MNNIKRVNVWDLDGTVINSHHRVQPCLKENGDLDLNKYRIEACTHAAIMADTFLPLLTLMEKSMSDPDIVNYIVTARCLSKSDYYYLRKHGLRGRDNRNVQVFDRSSLGRHFPLNAHSLYFSGDAVYKQSYLTLIKERHGDAIYTMYDDHDGVLDMSMRLGYRAVDAKVMNDYMTIGYQIAGEEFINESQVDDMDIEYLQQRLDFAWSSMTLEEQEAYQAKSHAA